MCLAYVWVGEIRRNRKRRRIKYMSGYKKHTIKTKDMIIKPVEDANIWEGEWTISIKNEDWIQIGTANFKGEKLLGTVPVTVTLDEKYRNKGYGTRAFKLLVEFAFGFKNIYEVKAVTYSDDDKCVYALEKAGFVRRNKEGKEETYSVIKPASTWMGLYIYIGIIIGLIIGIVVSAMWVGMVIGLVIGFVIGTVLDNEEKKERERVTGSKS